MTFSVFSDVLGMVGISVFSEVWEVDPWMAMYGHTFVVHWFHLRPLRICVGNDASEFWSNFQMMGVPGVPLRRICHASHVLLVECFVLHDNSWVRAMTLATLCCRGGLACTGATLGWLLAFVWPLHTQGTCVEGGNAECHEAFSER